MATAKRTQNKMDSNRDNAGEFIGSLYVTQSCNPCDRSNISKTATYFCVNCDEFLCDTCTHPHFVYKHGKHKIIGIRDMLDMKGLDRCQEHSQEVKLYCPDHSKLCCSTCAILHKKCHQM
ncbi:hypothetical protein DPMN_132475 [Dreissena polymorpha]|uniref:B box-type domain-containing protein n=1 Tax=Dreissena polymorpha TaxID=45954 RepID=A0A9D4FW05_DREPO|nr:hypothetical protein DPMN_132475 [Dreissena polymorpha]